MEKAFKILKYSEYYKQLKQHDECFKKAKEAFEIIGEKFNSEEFLSMNYVITGVEKSKTPEEFLSSLNDIIWLNKDIPTNILEKLDNSNFKTKDLIK